jgi:hypothetical protein
MVYFYRLLFIIFFLLYFSICFTQIIEKQNESILNKSDLLVNGRFYNEDLPNADGHPYLGSNDWIKSWISVEGVVFKNVDLKLDILSDKLILKSPDVVNNAIIELNPELIDSFKLGDKIFIQNRFNKIDLKYIELVYSRSIEFYKVYKKEFIEQYNSATPHGKISKPGVSRYIFIDGVINKVNSKTSFLDNFPGKKKEIKKYLKNNDVKYRSASNVELRQLIMFCESL